MNAKRIEKLYGQLSNGETFRLLANALGNRNGEEVANACSREPRESYSLPKSFGRILALIALHDQQRVECLELLVLHFRSRSWRRNRTASNLDESPRPRPIKVFGYLLWVHCTAWDQFCARRGIGTPLFEKEKCISQQVEIAMKVRYSAKRMQDFSDRGFLAGQQLITVENIANNLDLEFDVFSPS